MTINDAPVKAVGLPEFRQPTVAPPPPRDPGSPPAGSPSTNPANPTGQLPRLTPPNPKPGGPDGAATRTATSSAGEGLGRDHKHLGKTIAGLVALVFVIGDGLLRRYSRRGLRRPTKEQTQDFARPIAAIIVRHTDGLDLVPDVAELIEAGSAAGHYLLDGPLTVRARIEKLEVFDDHGEPDAPPRTMQPEIPHPPAMVPPPAPHEHVTYLA